MIWTREQYIAHCHHEYTGREMFCQLFGKLVGLEEEWRSQGATEKEIAMTAFDFDYVLKSFIPECAGAVTGLDRQILEDNESYLISKDRMGRIMKLCKGAATIPLPLDYPVKTMDDWLRIKHWYTFSEDRIDWEEINRLKALRDKGYLNVFFMPGGFDEPRQLMGEEGVCYAFYDEPEMIQDMLNTMADTTIKIIERIGEVIPIDNLSVHEDLAGKSGPLVGPNQINEFIGPYYEKVWNCAKAYGATLFSQDSDGNMDSVIDAFMSFGVNGFYPCEPAAGMDMVKLRAKYGKKLYYKGGIDKHVLRKDKAAILAELEYKMSGPMLKGGTVFAIDHLVPNGVPIENFRYYVEKGREILGLPPITGEGWERMAF